MMLGRLLFRPCPRFSSAVLALSRHPVQSKVPPICSLTKSYTTVHTSKKYSRLDNVKIFLKYTALSSSIGLFLLYFFDARAGFHKVVTMPMVRAFTDPEEAHTMAIKLAMWGVFPRDRKSDDEVLAVEIWGRKISNPVGLAAGFDKHGQAIDSMMKMGFGAVEIGSITPKPQLGNPKPRVFRLPEDHAVINRYGFNSDGHKTVLERLKHRIRRSIYHTKPMEIHSESVPSPAFHIPTNLSRALCPNRLLGINLGKNKSSLPESHSDYVNGVHTFLPYADYLVVNISSPNTPGLRSLQRKEVFYGLVKEVMSARDEALAKEVEANGQSRFVPLLIKIAPDLTEDEVKDIADVALDCKVDGIIISNTTIQRPNSLKSDTALTSQTGGLSGCPVKPFALSTLRLLNSYTSGRIPLVGCGGISSAEDAIEFAKAGATLVQLYTALAMDGPGVVTEIKDNLVRYLKEEGKTWQDLVGSGVKQ